MGLRLSYQSDPDFVSTCDHEHNSRCEGVSEIESALESVDILTGAKDEMKYVVSMANKKLKRGKLIYSDQSTEIKHSWIC